MKALGCSFKKSTKSSIDGDGSIKRLGKSGAVCKDVSSCFHLAMATQTLGALCREKALSVLPNGSMVKDGSSHPGT